jgi:hypothetical protein
LCLLLWRNKQARGGDVDVVGGEGGGEVDNTTIGMKVDIKKGCL